jgi:hypothetical protein
MRLSMDCKATVKIGEYSRGGKTRGDNQALDHDMGCQETYTPFGVVNEDSGHLHLSFGSSAKTSDFIVDSLYAWWAHRSPEERSACSLLQIKVDNGPESNGQRTQFLGSSGQFVGRPGLPGDGLRSRRALFFPSWRGEYPRGQAPQGASLRDSSLTRLSERVVGHHEGKSLCALGVGQGRVAGQGDRHPARTSEKMELRNNRRLGGERDAREDYPESGTEASLVCVPAGAPG